MCQSYSWTDGPSCDEVELAKSRNTYTLITDFFSALVKYEFDSAMESIAEEENLNYYKGA